MAFPQKFFQVIQIPTTFFLLKFKMHLKSLLRNLNYLNISQLSIYKFYFHDGIVPQHPYACSPTWSKAWNTESTVSTYWARAVKRLDEAGLKYK